jgi:hypothetical protein
VTLTLQRWFTRVRFPWYAGLLIALATGVASCAHHSTNASHQDPPLRVADSVRTTLLIAGREVLARNLAATRDTSPVCVSFANGKESYRLEPADLRVLADDRHRYVPQTACPPTYDTMAFLVDSHGRPVNRRPPNYVDPHELELVLPVALVASSPSVRVRIRQGTATDIYECLVHRDQGAISVSCRVIGSSLN